MLTKTIHDVVIVGGGPAGLTAGIYCKRAALDTILVEKGLLGGQIAISKDVENYPGLEGITGFDLAEKLMHHARSFGLDTVRQEVLAVEPGPRYHSVRLAQDEQLYATAVILAVGGTVRKLGIPGENEYLGAGVSYCGSCDGFFFRDRVVTVIGGGDTAVEEALYLSRLARKTYIIHRKNKFRAGKLLQQRLYSAKGIEILLNTIATHIMGDSRAVIAISYLNTATGQTGSLPTDGVFISIGHTPNTDAVPRSILTDGRGYIVTDEKCETSIPGIFAAGDLRSKFGNQIVIAAADGCVAALGAAHYIELQKGHSSR